MYKKCQEKVHTWNHRSYIHFRVPRSSKNFETYDVIFSFTTHNLCKTLSYAYMLCRILSSDLKRLLGLLICQDMSTLYEQVAY